MKRRSLLLAAGSAAAFVGCLRGDDEYGTVQRLGIINDRDEPATTELVIEHAKTGERFHRSIYEMGPGLSGQQVDCVWPDEPLLIRTRPTDIDEWNSLDTTEYEECLIVYSEIHDRGTSFYRAVEECPIRSPTCLEEV